MFMRYWRLTAILLCVLLVSCKQKFVTILHNQTGSTIQVIADTKYTIAAGGSAKIEMKVAGVFDILMGNGAKLHYYVGVPFPDKGYDSGNFSTATYNYAVIANGQIYALKTGETTVTPGEMQPGNFPVTPTPAQN
jgi:hypothetical protein